MHDCHGSRDKINIKLELENLHVCRTSLSQRGRREGRKQENHLIWTLDEASISNSTAGETLLVQRCCSSSVLPAGAVFPSLPLSDFQLALALLWDVLTGLIIMCACLISSLSPSDLVARPHWSAGEATRDNGGASPGVRNELNSGDGGVARPLAAPPPTPGDAEGLWDGGRLRGS